MSGITSIKDLRTVKLRNHHMSITVWPEGGRILEMKSMRTGNHMLSWWPYRIDTPAAAGGIGERTVAEGAAPYEWTQLEGAIRLTRTLPGQIVLEKTISLPADSLICHVGVTLRNTSNRFAPFIFDQSMAFCPGYGGACPLDESGISHCRQKAFLKRADEPVQEMNYEVYEDVHVDRDDVEWAVFVDPVTDDMIAALLAPGHVQLRTDYHWWLDWSREVDLAPGATHSVDFHFALTQAVNLPLFAGEHFLAGVMGAASSREDAGAAVRVYGLDAPAAHSTVSVTVNGKEVMRGKPLPDAREPLDVELPPAMEDRDLEVEVSVGGKYGYARLPRGRSADLVARLDAVCAEAVEAADAGRLSEVKAATVLAWRKVAQLNRDKSVRYFEPILEKALAEAAAALASRLEPPVFYSEAEEEVRRRMAGGLDLDAARATVLAALEASYDLSKPRFRAERPGAAALSGALIEAALFLSVRRDDEVLELFRRRLGELVAMWERYGEMLYETIHHGVILSSLVPAAKIAMDAGLLPREEAAGALAMILDLASKIRRHGGKQFRLSNWWAMEGAALGYTGALFPYLIEAGDYVSFAREALFWLLVHGTLSDGGFWEMSPSYHMVTLMYLWHITEALKRAGDDCYSSDMCGRHLWEMCDFFKKIAVPPGRVPAFDDARRDISPQVLLGLAKRFDDGELAYHADAAFAHAGRERGAWELFVPVETPRPVAPNRGNDVLTASGKLVLRAAGGSIVLALDYGPHGGWHGHNDKLTFELFWQDVCLVPDAGAYRYEDALHWDWFKTAPAHNTVTVDDRDQLPSRGRLIYFIEGTGCVTAALIAPTYEGIDHRREVTVSDRTVIIDDFLDGATPGTTMVWRLNSYVPFDIKDGTATFGRGGATVSVKPITEGVRMVAVEVPLAAEDDSKRSYVTGWQLRVSRTVAHESERILVKIDLSW